MEGGAWKGKTQGLREERGERREEGQAGGAGAEGERR